MEKHGEDAEAGGVDLWLVRLQDCPAGPEWLSQEEQSRADSFLNPAAARHYVAARWRLREILASYLECAPQAVALGESSLGKPILAGGAAPPLHFNLSHAGGHAIYAISRDAEAGVDLEFDDPAIVPDELAKTICSPEELRRFQAFNGNRRELFYRVWTRKEALAKCLGCGFGVEPDSLPVPIDDAAEAWALIEGKTVWLHTFRIGALGMASLAVRPGPARLKGVLWWPERLLASVLPGCNTGLPSR